jgi:hypothetical protein
MMARRVARLVVRRATPATLVAVAGRPTRASALSEERMGPFVCDHLGDKGSPHNNPTAAVKIANFFMDLSPFPKFTNILGWAAVLDTDQKTAVGPRKLLRRVALRQISMLRRSSPGRTQTSAMWRAETVHRRERPLAPWLKKKGLAKPVGGNRGVGVSASNVR